MTVGAALPAAVIAARVAETGERAVRPANPARAASARCELESGQVAVGKLRGGKFGLSRVRARIVGAGILPGAGAVRDRIAGGKGEFGILESSPGAR